MIQIEDKEASAVLARDNRLSWDDMWMLQALLIGQRSPDPNTQVGAVIVSQNNKPIASGYNGLPRGINPCQIEWNRKHDDPLKEKYPYIVHAEKNAISNATIDTTGAIIYTTLFPCQECTKDIIQAGIKEVIYLDNKYKDIWWTKASEWMLEIVDISTKQHKWETEKALSCLQTLLTHINVVK